MYNLFRKLTIEKSKSYAVIDEITRNVFLFISTNVEIKRNRLDSLKSRAYLPTRARMGTTPYNLYP